MKNLFIALTLLIGVSSSGWAQTDYLQWETHRFKVKMGQEDDFEKGLAAHNKKYHNAAPYKTWVYSLHTGPNSGQYEIALGPMTFTQLEGRPSGKDHDDDWAKVMSHVESSGESEYWRADKDINYQPAGSEAFKALRWRYFTVHPGQTERAESLFAQVEKVYEAKKLGAGYRLYWKWGASQGPHIVAEMSMASWAYFDNPNTFVKDFDEVHGEGAYDRFLEDMDRCIDRTKTYDELVMYEENLSSDN